MQPLNLIPLTSINDLVEGAASQRGNHLHDVMPARSVREHDFALWVAEFAKGRRGHVEGDGDFGSEHRRREVDVLHVLQDARPEPDLVVSGVVLAHCLVSKVSAYTSLIYVYGLLLLLWGFSEICGLTISSSAPLE